MDKSRIQEVAANAANVARGLRNLGVVGAATIGFAVAGYAGGEKTSPELDGVAGEILEHGIEAGGLATGAALGFIVGVWIIDGGLVEFLEGGP